MFCKSCGREIAEGTQFCPYCGASQNSANNVATTQESKVWGILSLIFGILGGLWYFRWSIRFGFWYCRSLYI